jgi:hypothetical protein
MGLRKDICITSGSAATATGHQETRQSERTQRHINDFHSKQLQKIGLI